MTRQVWVVMALCAGAVVGAAPTAEAAPAWLPPVELSPEVAAAGTDGPTTSVAVAPDGTAVAAWTRQTGGGRVLEAARRAPGGSFAALPSPAAGAAVSAEVGIDADGDATFVWQEGFTIRAARLPAGGSFETPQTLSTTGRYPAVAVGAGGTAVAVYQDLATEQVAAHIRATDGFGATFADPALISPAANSFSAVHGAGVADVAVAPDGRASVAWARYQSGTPSRYIVEVAERAPGAAFGLPADAADVSDEGPNASGTEPAVTIDAQGRTVVAWTHDADLSTEVDGPVTVHAARSPLTNPPVVASQDGVAAASPDLTLAGGEVVATWVAGTNPARRIEAASCGGDVFDCTGHAFVSPEGNGDTRPIIAGNAAGAAMVAWHGFTSEGIYTAFRPAGGSFGGTLTAESNAADPTRLRFIAPVTALDDEGNATALWTQFRLPVAPAVDSAHSIRGAGFDAVAPALSAVSVPATVSVGAAVPVSASATDRWGPVTLRWAFGDGSTADGGAAAHAFASVGPFDVTVTATDAVGNAAAAVRPLNVIPPATLTPPPPPPPPPPPTPRVAANVSLRWRVSGPAIKLERMRLTAMPAGATAELRCAGRRCPIRRTAIFSPVRGAIDIVRPLDVDQRRFRAGQRLDLRITAPGHIGQVLRFNLRRGRQPQPLQRCIPLGGSAVRQTC